MKISQIFSSVLIASALTLSSATMAATTSNTATTSTSPSLSPNQTQQIQKVVHDYLITNPQVLIEASQALQQQQMGQMQKNAQKSIVKNAKDIFSNPGSPVLGNAKGDVTVVEFMDYQCPHCKEMGPVLSGLIKGDPNVRVIIKEFPIFGDTSEYASKAALASQKQGKYEAFHDALLKDTNPLTHDETMKIAKSVGLDTNKLAQDMKDPAIDAQLKNTLALAKSLDLMVTPVVIVANRQGTKVAVIPGSTTKSNLQQLVTQMRQQ